MKLFDVFRNRRSADTAKERLQLLLAYERADRGRPDFLPQMQQEILQVVAKYMKVNDDQVEVKIDRGPDITMLEVNIELPATVVQNLAKAEPAARRKKTAV
ncbi:MAG: cell division topological specificity factor MinE [Alphaproteobacteria bacterium]|nr:cell division topological specificity factor MinE [Alphaproteobacteria bacterium]